MAAVSCEDVNNEEEEIPLEIEDYSCNTFFEITVANIERYLVEEFRNRLELQRFLVNPKKSCEKKNSNCISGKDVTVCSCNNGCSSVVLGRNFPIGNIGSPGIKEKNTDDEGIAVEIHIQNLCCNKHENKQQQLDRWHPIARLFAFPLFFFARSTTTASSHCKSESSFYLSLLTTAVGRALRGPLSLRFDSDSSFLPSPFFYANGIAPCFVSVGDHYQLAFNGLAPVVMVSGDGMERWSLSRLIVQPVVRCRFQCTAYPRPPEWCQHISDYLDMFQLQIGPQSRVRTDVFDGICVSLQQTFQLDVPLYFMLNDRDANKDKTADKDDNNRGFHSVSLAVDRKQAKISWSTVLELENNLMLLSVGQTTFPFGTATAPLQAINFIFQWNQIHDTEVQDDASRCSNMNPFSSAELLLSKRLSIKAVAFPKKEYELNHAACKRLSEYAYMVLEHLFFGESEVRPLQKASDTLVAIADEIINCQTVDVSEQKAFIDRLTEHRQENMRFTWGDVRNVYFPGSLLCRFAYVCAERLEEIDDLSTLWLLIVERLKKLFESVTGRLQQSLLVQIIKIIGVPPVSEIDHGLPLLVQKLQLLSYCARRMLDECEHTAVIRPEDGWDDDSEEYFSHNIGNSPANSNEIMKYGVVSSGKYLISNGEPLVEPQGFPTPPCTSDVFMMKAQELQNLGTASAGQHARAWIQSTGLFNDMCLFLYVNRAHEGRVVRFPDFVQWHSPRDFIPPSGDLKPRVGVVLNEADDDDDDAYLSERMRRNSTDKNGLITNVWWPLWDKATPRSPEEIIAQSFVPYEQAQLIFRWMEKDLSVTRLILETVHANVSNSLHRILSHRRVKNNSAMANYALGKSEAIATSIKNVMQIDDSSINDESLRTIYSVVIRQIGEIETCLCASLAIERLLRAPQEACDAPPKGEVCTSLEELVAALSCPVENNEDLVLREALLNLDLWHNGGIKLCFKENRQKAISMYLRATCMAERPLNTTACFQQMFAEIDETGVFRVALALTEEVF